MDITKELVDERDYHFDNNGYGAFFGFDEGGLYLSVSAQDGGHDNGWMYLPHIKTMEQLEQLYKLLGGL